MTAKETLAGKRVKCPQCGSVVNIPKPSDRELDEERPVHKKSSTEEDPLQPTTSQALGTRALTSRVKNPLILALAAGGVVTLVLLGTMIVLNLFIGVIMTGMDAANAERERMEEEERRTERDTEIPPMSEELEALTAQLDALQAQIARLKHRAERAEKAGT